jgi:hypothetical protein
MYTVQEAIGVPFGLNKRWQVVDLTQYTMSELYVGFRRVQITLLEGQSTTPEYLDIQDIAPTYATSTLKFSGVLSAIGDSSLPTTETGLIINQRKALYRDAIRSGYRALPVNQNNVPDTSIDARQLPNIRLTKIDNDVDYAYAFKRCMVSVNGYYHSTDTDGVTGLMVKDAMKSLVISNQDQIGLLSFSSMCELSYVSVTTEMIDASEASAPVVNLGIDLTNKSVLLVLGGYMQFIDSSVLTQVGASSFKIDFTQIDIVNRYFESLNYLDLNSLGLNPTSTNETEITVEDLTSAEVVAAWLALSQTFFVILDTPSLYTQKRYVARSGIPNAYFCYSQPNDALVMELGRHPSYWVTYDDHQWRMSLYNNVVPNSLYYSDPLPDTIYTNGAAMPGTTGHLNQAYLLEIGRDY